MDQVQQAPPPPLPRLSPAAPVPSPPRTAEVIEVMDDDEILV